MADPSENTNAFRLHASKYMKVAGLTILAYDYCITADQEIALLWGTEWGIARILFCVARYLPFVDAAVYHYYAFADFSGPDGYHRCFSVYYAALWLNVLGICAAEGLLILRTYAILKCRKALLYGLLVFVTAVLIAAFVIQGRMGQGLAYGPPPAPWIPGCFPTKNNNSLFSFFILLVIFESAILGLTVYQAKRHLRRWSSRLVQSLYRDGLLYVTVLLFMSTVNIIVMTTIPANYNEVFYTFPGIMHSVLASRIMFKIRESAQCEDDEDAECEQIVGTRAVHVIRFAV
ncbi:hypothetical protein BV22DRAFT_532808 [Leucogyrophana mollusca]|uniref:Uncharacterized protein n=1 Tax=Leucogyrophana mollusca TaxID=85980 RepID=A0ACB8BG44_9AGAM|nr:hypothetical protein BV22DRAFT_532808 [Leucogyrophana mollusca]